MSDSNVTAAFATLESNPYVEWKEDLGLDSSLDIENIPECSQELARELLHKKEVHYYILTFTNPCCSVVYSIDLKYFAYR